mmetsp:Transcript_26851/g.67506  ORF Transcript_26851/g.67506 Transcript_26851/m.67506 type:complete len:259 (-) Transcript_26851:395-1171(-)
MSEVRKPDGAGQALLGEVDRIARKFVTYLDKTDGRDKCYRLAQYAALFSHYLLSFKSPQPTQLMGQLKALVQALGMGRKIFRLGKFIHSYYNIQKALDESNQVVRVAESVRHFSLLVYFFCDQTVWLGKIKAMNVGIDQPTIVGVRAWWLALILALIADFARIRNNLQESRELKENKISRQQSSFPPSEEMICSIDKRVETLRLSRQTLYLKCIKNLADLPIGSMGALPFMKKHEGLIGFCGLISSVVACYLTWPKSS